MKYRIISLLALAGMLFNCCAVDEMPSSEGSIRAEMENEDTRTTVTDEGAFTWSTGDQVWLHTTSGSVVGTLTSGAGTSSADFSFGSHFGEMTGNAVYPYNDGHSISDDVLTVVMPATYNLGSSLNNTNAAMYAVNEGGTLKFNHLAGVMRFKFKNVPAGVNKFTITLDKKINGTFTADLTADYPVVETASTSKSSEKTIALTFNALSKTSDICLYVPLPLGTYTSLELVLYDDAKSVWSYSNTVANTISRKTLKLMPVVTLDGSVGGDIEGGESDEDQEAQEGDYIDEYGVNHGQGVKIGKTVWAPVNCGYHETDFKYGKLYQWGRKYGQGYSGEFYDGDWDQTYSDAIVSSIEEGGISAMTGQHESKSNVFFTSTSGFDYDWLYPQDSKLWNSGSESNPLKTEYDPCPEGWRVPTYAELDELNNNHSSWTINENGQPGCWFSGASSYTETVPQVFFPAAGYRDNYGRTRDRGYVGCYWSSRPSSTDVDYLRFSDYVGLRYNPRAYGYSVRCVQDDSELIPVESVSLNKTSLTLSVGASETLSSTITPSNANHQSVHWWSDNPEVATVDLNGNVNAVSKGNTKIYAMAGMQVATCSVTVDVFYIDEYGVNHGQGIKIGKTVWAPVNCGYHETDYKYGKLYQWGRKYGQGYNGELYDRKGRYVGQVSDVFTAESWSATVSLTKGQSEDNENEFYYSRNPPYDWLYPQDDKLWNSGSESNPVKTEYDPCPDGWRVPTEIELYELYNKYSSWTTNENGQPGYWFSGARSYTETVPQVFFPAAGYRNNFSLTCRRGLDGRYWSSRPSLTDAWYLSFSDGSASMHGDYRANGYSVRCVQE